jgi:ATP-dependent RNA helicase DeaD
LSTSHPSRRRPASRGPSKPHASGPRQKIEPLHPTDIPPDIHSFREWALGDAVQDAIAAMQITVPSPIQKLAIGPVLEGRDVIAKAETGTGKTLAFGAPMMAKIDPARASVLGLVLCPTRELAEQVCKVLAKLGEPRNIKVALIVGGEPLGPQVAALKAGSQVVVGTPGRILDLYNQKFLSFPWTEFAVLDEADVMLEIGFIDDVKMILSFTPDERQTLLFSATFPPELLKLARAYTKNPVEVATAAGVATVDTIEQSWMKLDDEDRPLALMRLIEQSDPTDVFLVFCDRRTDVDRLMRRLERQPFSVKALHGGYDQEARFRVMSAFRTAEVKALVATDVASRGLDVAHVTHVINYGSPRDITAYTHRIGRTGRAGRQGRAMTFVTRPGMVRWKRILEDANWKIAEVDPPGPSRGSARGPRRDDARAPVRTDRTAAPVTRPEREEREPVRETVRESAPARSEREAPAARQPREADRNERPAHRERGARPERSERGPARDARPARSEPDARPARTERPAHRESPSAHADRAAHPPRGERGPRREAPAQHSDREARPARREGGERSDARPREARPEPERPHSAPRREARPEHAPRERTERPRESAPPARRREAPRDDVLPPVREPLRESEVRAERERLRERKDRPQAEHAPRAPRAENPPAEAPHRSPRHGSRTHDAAPAPARPPRRHSERGDPPREPTDAPRERADATPDRERAAPSPSRSSDRPHGGGRPRHEPKDARPAKRDESRPAKAPAREHKPRPHGDRSDFGDGL